MLGIPGFAELRTCSWCSQVDHYALISLTHHLLCATAGRPMTVPVESGMGRCREPIASAALGGSRSAYSRRGALLQPVVVRSEAGGMFQLAVHRAILIVDVENFGDPNRTNTHQLAIRDTVYKVLQQSFEKASITWAKCVTEDRGDGVLILIPPTVPKSLLVEKLPARLAEMLIQHNAGCPAQVRIRLRVALHAGEVHSDEHGHAGTSINRAFRLIEASASRTALRQSSGVVALVVSDWFYDEVVRHCPDAEPSYFRKVHVTVKESKMTAWIRILGPDERSIFPDARPQPGQQTLETLPIIEHYRLQITLHESVAVNDTIPVSILAFDREYSAFNGNDVAARFDLFHHTTGPLGSQSDSRPPQFTYICMDMDDTDDALEWDPGCDSTWSQSPDGRSMCVWRGSDVSIGRELDMQNMLSLRIAELRMDPGSTLHAKIISETQVAATGSEPFVVVLPTRELEVVVICSHEIKVALFPLYAAQGENAIPKTGVAFRGDSIQETTWRWRRALTAGQGVILRWARRSPELLGAQHF
jgi:hypothetical protein